MWENILKNVIILKSYFPYHGAQYGFFIIYLYVLVFFQKGNVCEIAGKYEKLLGKEGTLFCPLSC